jgi:hypothetical protein
LFDFPSTKEFEASDTSLILHAKDNQLDKVATSELVMKLEEEKESSSELVMMLEEEKESS